MRTPQQRRASVLSRAVAEGRRAETLVAAGTPGTCLGGGRGGPGTAQAPRAPTSDSGFLAHRAQADYWVAGAIVVLVVGRVLFVLTAPISEIVYRTTDDAYYYFNVARNLTAGHGLTFDGMNPTNGFHPLWMLVLLPLYWLTGAYEEGSTRAVYSLVTVLAGATLWLAYRAISTLAGRGNAAVATSLLLTPVFANTLLNGLETGLLLLLLFGTLRLLTHPDLARRGPSLRLDVLTGLLLALVLLCRLDSVFLVVALLGLYASWPGPGVGRSLPAIARRLTVASLPVLLALSAYVLWNLIEFGHATPISGALKSTFPRLSFTSRRLVEVHELFGLIQLAFAALGLALLTGSSPSSPEGPSRAGRGFHLALLAALWAGCFVHFAHSVLYMEWAVHWWHFASYVPLTIAVAALVWGHTRSRFGWPTLAGVLVSVVLVSVGLYRYDDRARSVHEHLLAAARWSGENLPKEAVIGMTDSGIYGYFSGRPTVNLDGVINSYAYQNALRDGRLPGFLRSCGVTHIADYEVVYRDGRFVIPLPARLHDGPGASIVATADAEVYRSHPYYVVGEGERHFAIWELARLDVVPRATREGNDTHRTILP